MEIISMDDASLQHWRMGKAYSQRTHSGLQITQTDCFIDHPRQNQKKKKTHEPVRKNQENVHRWILTPNNIDSCCSSLVFTLIYMPWFPTQKKGKLFLFTSRRKIGDGAHTVPFLFLIEGWVEI